MKKRCNMNEIRQQRKSRQRNAHMHNVRIKLFVRSIVAKLYAHRYRMYCQCTGQQMLRLSFYFNNMYKMHVSIRERHRFNTKWDERVRAIRMHFKHFSYSFPWMKELNEPTKTTSAQQHTQIERLETQTKTKSKWETDKRIKKEKIQEDSNYETKLRTIQYIFRNVPRLCKN